MNKRALKVLEYNKIIDKLVDNAVSPMAKEIVAGTEPYTDLETVKLKQSETTEATTLLYKKASIPLGGLKDIRMHIKRAEVAATLSMSDLIEVADTLETVSKVKKYYSGDNTTEIYHKIGHLFENLYEFRHIVTEINRCIKSPEDMDDNASAELSSIRKQIASAQNRVKEKLSSVIQSQAYKTMLQDAIVTMRENRYCVPVKQEYRGQFKGIIHDQSSTGSTLFIEPIIVVELNNKIRDLENKEREEIDRILKMLTGIITENVDVIKTNLELLTELDVIFARGKLSIDMQAAEPIYNDNLYLNLKRARHPLIKKEDVVPIDVYLGKDFSTLIITGPNTGGKTVTLKTVGLFALMGQSGLHIPAFDYSELCIFDDVFADIGDEQSIEQSLSTFSSHMKNIVSILENVTFKSLALFDELGAGTDPIEGAALAMAILRKLGDRRIRTVATTHYSELKNYALTQERVENASCEFDIATLRPTYRLLIGVPGKSNAFLISKKLGLRDDVIDMARESIKEENINMEEVLSKLEQERRTIEDERRNTENLRISAEKLKNELEASKEKMIAQREKLIREAKEEALEIYNKAKAEIEDIIKEARQAKGEIELQNIKKKATTSSKNIQSEITKNFLDNKKVNTNPIKDLKEGETVYVSTFDQKGTVVTLPDSKEELYVQIGIMKVKANLQNVFRVDDHSKEKIVKKFDKMNSVIIKQEKVTSVVPEINLIGKYVEDALYELDKFLDDMSISNVEKVRVVHGKGTGALRRAVQDYLKSDHRVGEYRLGSYGEGDLGVTIVEMR